MTPVQPNWLQLSHLYVRKSKKFCTLLQKIYRVSFSYTDTWYIAFWQVIWLWIFCYLLGSNDDKKFIEIFYYYTYTFIRFCTETVTLIFDLHLLFCSFQVSQLFSIMKKAQNVLHKFDDVKNHFFYKSKPLKNHLKLLKFKITRPHCVKWWQKWSSMAPTLETLT